MGVGARTGVQEETCGWFSEHFGVLCACSCLLANATVALAVGESSVILLTLPPPSLSNHLQQVEAGAADGTVLFGQVAPMVNQIEYHVGMGPGAQVSTAGPLQLQQPPQGRPQPTRDGMQVD